MIDAVIEELKTHQTQLDQDGVMVGVSRQALEELLAHVAAPAHPATIAGLEPVAWRAPTDVPSIEFGSSRDGDGIKGWRELPQWGDDQFTRAQLEANAAEQVRAEREACHGIANGDSALRWCGYCESWRKSPCGEGCHWLPSDPTLEQMAEKRRLEMRAHYRKYPLPVTFEDKK